MRPLKSGYALKTVVGPPAPKPVSMDGADGVYPPSEDTFLLIDALQKDKAFIRDRLGKDPFFVEIGYVELH